MLRKKNQSARCAKKVGITDKLLYLCGERVAATLGLAVSIFAPANGISYHISIGCPPFGTAIQRTQNAAVYGTRYPSRSHYFSGFSKLIRYLTQPT